jgi:hypothetical protein
MRDGFKVIDLPPKVETKVQRPLGPREIRRADFDALGQYERAAKMKAGYRVVD